MPRTLQLSYLYLLLICYTISVVACTTNKQRLNHQPCQILHDGGILRLFFCICLSSSSHQTWSLTDSWPCGYFPCASLTKVGLTEQVHPAPKSRLVKRQQQSQVSYWFFCSSESLLLYLVHPPVELSTGPPGLGRECLCHISDGAGTICSPAENSPAGSFPPKHRPPNSHPHI